MPLAMAQIFLLGSLRVKPLAEKIRFHLFSCFMVMQGSLLHNLLKDNV